MNELPLPLLVRDDFAADALEVRDAVIRGGFKTEIGPDGAPYTGISDYAVPHWHARIAEMMGFPIVPRLSCFRVNYQGEIPPVWVHSDGICADGFASVLYLNLPEQCKGGTAFWRHRALNIEAMPAPDHLARLGLNPPAFAALVEREWRVLEAWEMIALADMKFNRFISYPTSLFHSRFPFEGFGTEPADGRLIWVCFFDKE